MESDSDQRSVEELQAAVGQDPRDVRTRLRLAHVLLEGGEPEAAAEQFREIVRLDPEDPWLLSHAHLYLGDFHMEQGQIDEAICEFRAVLRVRPGHPSANLCLGDLLNAKGSAAEAREHWKSVLAFAGEDSQLYQAVEARKRLERNGGR